MAYVNLPSNALGIQHTFARKDVKSSDTLLWLTLLSFINVAILATDISSMRLSMSALTPA